MKKYFSLLLVIMCMLVMVACGEKTKNTDEVVVGDVENIETEVVGDVENESSEKNAITVRHRTPGENKNDDYLLDVIDVYYFEDNKCTHQYKYHVYSSEEVAEKKYQEFIENGIDNEMTLEKSVIRIYYERTGESYETRLEDLKKSYGILADITEEEVNPIENYEEIIAYHLQPLTKKYIYMEESDESTKGMREEYKIYWFDETGHTNGREVYQVYNSEKEASEQYVSVCEEYGSDINVLLEGRIIHIEKHDYRRADGMGYLRGTLRGFAHTQAINGSISEEYDGVVTP